MDVASSSATVRGLQDGYSQEQWGPWKSHGLLLQQSIAELGWQDAAQTLAQVFKEYSGTREGYLSRDEFFAVMQTYPCCNAAHHQVFFELFDRNQDGFLSEADFLGGLLAVSPLTPHKLESPAGQLRMQFIFLYYDANRNGRLEVEEVAKMIEHIQQLRGQPHSDAMVDATALTSLYSGPFGYAAFHDAAQKRMLNGTSPLLRLQQDLLAAIRGVGDPASPVGGGSGQAAVLTGAPVSPGPAHAPGPPWLLGGLPGEAQSGGPASGSANCSGGGRGRPDDPLGSLGSLPGGHTPPLGSATGPALPAQQTTAHAASRGSPSATRGAYAPPPPGACGGGGGGGGGAGGGGPLAGSPQAEAEVIALRIVRRLMELSNQERSDWRYNLQLATFDEALLLCGCVVEILRREDSLVEVLLPCRVYGDIHGQLLDLLEFFNAFAWPDKRRGDIWSMSYVFLGDFVDRGAYSCDVVLLLFSLKFLYPRKVFLVRGNHEDRLMNINYGFHESCTRKFAAEGEFIWERMNDVFEFLPIAALVDSTILCIHGGIGDCIDTLDDLRGIPKPIQVVGEINSSTTRQDRIILHALWSDPTDNDQVLGVHSSPRGKNTCRFGPDRVQDFNRRNGLKLIIRAHECVQHGYEYFASGQLLTVFSATNYCNEHNNDGAMVILVRDEWTGEVKEHAQVIKSGAVDTSYGWNDQQFRAPSPMRRADGSHETVVRGAGVDAGPPGGWAFGSAPGS